MTAPCPTFGFLVAMDLAPRLQSAECKDFRNAWDNFIEARGLYCGGGGSGHRLEFAVLSEASQANESDRVATESWLASRRELSGWRVGPLQDLGADD